MHLLDIINLLTMPVQAFSDRHIGCAVCFAPNNYGGIIHVDVPTDAQVKIGSVSMHHSSAVIFQIAKCGGSTSIRSHSDTKMRDPCLIDLDPIVFAIGDAYTKVQPKRMEIYLTTRGPF